MMKNIKIILLALIISFFIGYFLISDYLNNNKDITYAIIYGEYNKDEFEKETLKLNNYIYRINNDKYIVYLGLTRNEKNISKLKEFYQKKGYSISIGSIKVDDKLKSLIEDCDILLEKVSEEETIEKIENKILEYGVI